MMTVSQSAHPVFIVYFEECIAYISFIDLVVIQVNWTISQAISVTEGDVVILCGEAFGIYANEVAIGVDCSETIATDVEPGMNTISSTDASRLELDKAFHVRKW